MKKNMTVSYSREKAGSTSVMCNIGEHTYKTGLKLKYSPIRV